MQTWDRVVKNALEKLVHADQYAYFFGAKGQRLTWDVMNYLWNAEPSYFKRYSEKEKADIFAYSCGKIGYDCSGFISAITGCHADSMSLFARCTNKTADLSKGVAGSLLWMKGHIGLDVGNGFFVHCGRELDTICIGKLSERNPAWEQCGQLTSYIDYKGATNI